VAVRPRSFLIDEAGKAALALLLKRPAFRLALNDHHPGRPGAVQRGLPARPRGHRVEAGGLALQSRPIAALKAKNADSPAARREAIEDWGRRG
jgi:hypothetical protein